MAEIGTESAPLRVAIVGSGPAGFYAADALLRDGEPHVEVDMIDRLPTPYGLVRGGVAPDHPKIKSVIRVYERTAAKPGFRFFGNIEVGRDVSAAELAERHHAVIWSYGAETDRHLGIPGEELPGSHPATAFVGWYNAHPDYTDFEIDLSAERAVVVGNGNVAMDVTRMLALTPEELAGTDVADHGLEGLRDCGVREILVLGRRGPAQAAFTNPEIRELGEMEAADCIVEEAEVELDDLSRAYLDSEEADITARKNVEILTDFSRRRPEGKPKRIVLRFLTSPIEIHGTDRVEAITVGRNELIRAEDGTLRAQDTGERERIECGLVLRSVGYRGIPVEGLPFDQGRGTISNDRGRVVDPESGDPVTGHYVAGWIKRGPSGVIGTNKKDAQETVELLTEDLAAGRLPSERPGPEAIEELLAERQPDCISFQGWEAIDRAEVERGEEQGRPRVKFCRIEEMVQAARGAGVT